MDKLLKGNYDLANKTDLHASVPKDDKQGFEDKAMERLGGSIAFVMKGNKFIWDDEDDQAEDAGTAVDATRHADQCNK